MSRVACRVKLLWATLAALILLAVVALLPFDAYGWAGAVLIVVVLIAVLAAIDAGTGKGAV